MEKIRNYKMDYIKGISIFLVVWGHIVQHFYGGFDGDFYGNIVYKVIYTFHMPLFMFISGYFFKPSLDKRSFWEILYLKFLQLGVPIIIWTIFYYIENLLYTGASFSPRELFRLFFRRLWFLSALFMLIVLISIVWQFWKKYSTGFILTCVILSFLILIVPDELFSAVYLKFMYPYFIAGILTNAFQDKLREWKTPFYLLGTVIFLLLLPGFQDNYYVYTSGMYLPFGGDLEGQLFIIYYRYIIGFAGIITIMGILSFLYSLEYNKFFIQLGNYTLGIYIVHIFFLNYFGRWDIGKYFPMNEWVYNLLFTPAVSILLTLICVGIILLINKNKYLKGILFGNWR